MILLPYSIILLLFFCSLRLSSAQSCNCNTCTTSTSVGAGGSFTDSLTSPCPSGQVAVISNLDVMSTDGSSFTVYTKDTVSSSTYYNLGSSASAVTCFDSPFGQNVGGLANTISITFICQNIIESCPLNYGATFSCITTGGGGGTVASSTGGSSNPCAGVYCGAYGLCSNSNGFCTCTSGYTGANCQIPPNTNSGCQCTCCIGSGCTPTYTGNAGACYEAGSCSSSCMSSFPQYCPPTGASGTLSSSCLISSSNSQTSSSSTTSASSNMSTIYIAVGASVGGALLISTVVALFYYRHRKSQQTAVTASKSGVAMEQRPSANIMANPALQGTGNRNAFYNETQQLHSPPPYN